MTEATVTEPTVADPIRAEVERLLHLGVSMAIALPLAATQRTQRCLRSQFERAGERLLAPLRLVRSLIDVAGTSSVVAPVDDAVPTPVAHRALKQQHAPAKPRRRGAHDEDDVVATGPSTEADDMPIEEYESLAASHVVARLEQLTPDELQRVHEFESANRGRRTVLGKIEQLLGGA